MGSTILKTSATGASIINDWSSLAGTVSLGFNLSSDDGGGFLTNATDQVNTDPLLGPLQNNGPSPAIPRREPPRKAAGFTASMAPRWS